MLAQRLPGWGGVHALWQCVKVRMREREAWVGMPFYDLDPVQNDHKPRGCHEPYLAPRKSALPLRMAEVENPTLSLAGPAPLAILTPPPLRSDSSIGGVAQLVEPWEAAD